MARLFLGLDSSTQSLSAVVIDLDARRVVYETSLNFDRALPQYRTQNGVLPNRNPLVKHSSPRLWAAALDLIFAQMQRDGVALDKILAISGSGQQHGSVYLNNRTAKALAGLRPERSLVDNLKGIFSRPTAPIWMDSSTAPECAEIRKKLGGIKATAQVTGSDAFERFTGPQIRKFFKTEPKAYAQTAHIALVSSFMASLLAGRIAPIDFGDGAGMNLMDIRKRCWHAKALATTAPRLKGKLPSLAGAGTVIGKVSPYFVEKFGLNPEALATVWTGDNPASVIGLGLIRPGQVAISLGTSDTFFGSMQTCRTDAHGEGHVFGSPAGGYMTLICFKNGSLAREKIREQYRISDWKKFGKLVESTLPGNGGAILLPWFEAEIVPRVNRPGIHRFDLEAGDAAANCRAIFEAQAMAMRLHSQWMGGAPKQILATGGASNDRALLQVLADVMNCRVLRIEVSKSAALGAALIAAHGWPGGAWTHYGGQLHCPPSSRPSPLHLRSELRRTGFLDAPEPWQRRAGEGETLAASWEKVIAGFCRPVPGSEIRPNKKAAKVYAKMVVKYAECEKVALKALKSI